MYDVKLPNPEIVTLVVVDCGSWWLSFTTTRAQTTFSSTATGYDGSEYGGGAPPPPPPQLPAPHALPLLLNGCALGRSLSFLHSESSLVWFCLVCQCSATAELFRVSVPRITRPIWDQSSSGVKTIDMVHIWNNNVKFCDLIRFQKECSNSP